MHLSGAGSNRARVAGWLEVAQVSLLATLTVFAIFQARSINELRTELRMLKRIPSSLDRTELSLEKVSQSVASLAFRMQKLQALSGIPQLAIPESHAQQQSSSASNLYLGDGLVMCYVQPLGVHMILEGSDKGLTPHLCRGVGWEPEISAVLNRLIQPGSYVLDVGTNIGYYTVMFAQRVGPSGRVLGVEASPRTYDVAGRSLEMLGYLSSNTQLINRAVYSEDNKVVKITTDKKRPLNNHVTVAEGSQQQPADISEAVSADVQTITIDAAVASWEKLDLIKIDVEGAEAEAYKGLKKTIARFPNLVVVMEVNTLRMGEAAARTFYEGMAQDFKQLRRIVGDQIRNTDVSELLANKQGDDLVVLTRRGDV